jgi:hypothetical protein
MRCTILFASIALAAAAQETVAPTPDRPGSPRGETWNNYNIVNSMETGYRFATVGGDVSTYRSAVNYGNGVRLLSSYFTMNSKEGHGGWFDSITITTQGLGNDPYEMANFRIEKKRTYLYDMTWRRNDYFNPGLVSAGASGNHLVDTEYDMQDHDFTLFPDSNLKFFLGFTGTSQTGAGLTTALPATSNGDAMPANPDVVPLFANIRRYRHEYRVGNEFRLFGVRVNWLHGWDDFKEDTPASSVNGTRLEPYHGTSPYWRVGVFSDHKVFGVNGRFTYTAGRRAFITDETIVAGGIASQQSRQVVAMGNGDRPVATGNLNLTFTPGSKLTIVNSTSIYNVRTSGNASWAEFDNGSLQTSEVDFQYLKIRTFANETDLNYQFSPLFGAFAGYEYSNRRIRSIQQFGSVALPGDQTNLLNDGRLGFRFRPLKSLTVLVSGEIGRNSRPFYPIAERNFHALDARVQYRSRALLLSAGAESSYRFNSVAVSSFSSQSRKYFANGSWTVKPWLSFDGSFSRAHLYTIGGIAYFALGQPVDGQSSIYISNLNTAIAGIRFAIGKRVDVYAAYVWNNDEGDGRSSPGVGLLEPVQTYPLTYQSPFARLSLRILEKLRWNAGYQYYGFRADFYPNRNFRANTGYTSLSWSF